MKASSSCRTVVVMVASIAMTIGHPSMSSAADIDDDFASILVAYYGFVDARGRGPKSADDLLPYFSTEKKYKRGLNTFKDGGIIAIYGYKLKLANDESEIVILYEKDVPTKGGWVCTGNATCKKMTPEEFFLAPKPIGSGVTLSITLDKQLKHVEVHESAPIRAAKESPQVKKEEYTIKHSVTYQEGWKAEGDVKANLSIIEIGIKGEISRSTSKTYEVSKTTTREVTIPGNEKPYKVIWIETYQTGKATVIIDGKKHEVPFQFRVGWDLQTKEVK